MANRCARFDHYDYDDNLRTWARVELTNPFEDISDRCCLWIGVVSLVLIAVCEFALWYFTSSSTIAVSSDCVRLVNERNIFAHHIYASSCNGCSSYMVSLSCWSNSLILNICRLGLSFNFNIIFHNRE